MARTSKYNDAQKNYRQIIVDYLAKDPSAFDGHAYYNDFEDSRITPHINENYGATCSLKPASEAKIRIAEATNPWADHRDETWLTVATGYECACGEHKGITLVAQGDINEVLLRALDIEPRKLLG